MKRKRNKTTESMSSKVSSSPGSNSISTRAIKDTIEKLKMEKYRESSRKNYYRVWEIFNRFFIQLDIKPTEWADHITLFAGYLTDQGKQ